MDNMASKFQRGYDDERFETIVNRNFHCLICLNVLRDPVMCRRNQHYFCRGCISEHLHTNSQTCPTCADELSVETLCDVPRIVKDYLDELNIRCDYYERGCRELVQLQNLEQHVAECGFAPVVCGNQGCCETVSKRDRMYHESEQCEFRKLKCHNCGEISTKMIAMDTRLLDMDSKMEMISTKVGMVDTKMGNIHTKMTNMDTRISANLGDMETKMNNVDTKAGYIWTKLKSINTTMGNNDKRMEDVDRKVRNVETKIANTARNVENGNKKIADIGKQMDKNTANVQAKVEANFRAVNSEVRGMKNRLTGFLVVFVLIVLILGYKTIT